MKERENPCLCVICKCGSITMATTFKAITLNDEFIISMENRAKEGYAIECIDASLFNVERCKCKE